VEKIFHNQSNVQDNRKVSLLIDDMQQRMRTGRELLYSPTMTLPADIIPSTPRITAAEFGMAYLSGSNLLKKTRFSVPLCPTLPSPTVRRTTSIWKMRVSA